jgi:hypothetical protein
MESSDFDKPKYYAIKLKEQLETNWADWFDGFVVEEVDDGTLLKGYARDQSALHGLLVKVRDLGLTLISVTEIQSW